MRGVLLGCLAFLVAGCGCQEAAPPAAGAGKPSPVNPPADAQGQAGQAAGGPETGLAAPSKSGDSELEINPNANFNTGK
ncbi:MAG: hypothetical protein IT207_03225 [Fimbriimonadaceae bacterium]|nr:hypothetical protein [Fimbriimonadaceae bacterium]